MNSPEFFGGGIMRIKLIKNHKQYKKNEIIEVSPNEGFGLIDSGVGKVTKDMTEGDYKIKRRKT